jgi:phosphatidylglycerol---prolipoprotein diacylglyceryl transferase
VLGPLATLNLGGGLILPVYPLFISLLFTGLIFYLNKRAYKRDHSGATALDLFIWVTLAGAMGARLFHVIYEEPDYYIENPLRVFYFWQGGFVFYGGVITGFFAGWLNLKIKQQSFPLWLDFFTPVISLGYAFGRWACFLAGCCYGKICEWPWAVAVTQIDTDKNFSVDVHRHPTQLYASLLEFALFYILMRFEKKRVFKKPGHLFYFWLGVHSLSRLFIELFRDDDRGAMIGPMSISMLLSCIFAGVAFVVLFRGQKKTRK